MPHLRLETNVPKSKISNDFLSRATSLVAKALGKPNAYCVVTIVPDVLMAFGGTEDPCAIGTLMSIGALGIDENKKISKVLYEFIEKELGIPPNRMYITYQNEPSANVGFNGSTFHDILG